jgi:dynein heavy chain
LQELDHWNRLVNVMSSSLRELQKALLGEIGMSQAASHFGRQQSSGMHRTALRALARVAI